MNPGASVTVDGKTVTLIGVGPTTVVVDVDGVTEVVSSNTETVNGIQIKLISSTPNPQSSSDPQSSATIRFGTCITTTFNCASITCDPVDSSQIECSCT